jgi:2'-phosphotransferase
MSSTQLNNRNLKSLKITFAELKEVVAENDKQRFSLISINEAPSTSDRPSEIPSDDSATANTTDLDETDPSNYLIRANQGHSIKVEDEGLLEPITLESELPTTVVHGTTHRAWPLILSTGGLKKMTRNHVHFAAGLPAGFKSLEETEDAQVESSKDPVISGMRNSSGILVFIDLKKALESGLKFGRSANGVILSEGNEDGIIPTQYFLRVEERKRGLGIIMKDGEIVKELPTELIRGTDSGQRGGRGEKRRGA